MIDFLAARVMHLLFSLAAALVVYCLMWSILSRREHEMNLTLSVGLLLVSSGVALFVHWLLDVVVGVP